MPRDRCGQGLAVSTRHHYIHRVGKSPVEEYFMPSITRIIIIKKPQPTVFKEDREASDITSEYDKH